MQMLKDNSPIACQICCAIGYIAQEGIAMVAAAMEFKTVDNTMHDRTID
jgi:hypothetical protein